MPRLNISYWWRGCSAAAVLVLLCLAPQATSATETKINLRVGAHSSFNRLVFDWPARVPYQLSRNGNTVELVFARAAQIQPPADLARQTRLGNFTARTENDKTIVNFVVAADATLKDFLSGNSVVVDINGSAAPAVAAAATQAPTLAASPAAAASAPALTAAPPAVPAAVSEPAQLQPQSSSPAANAVPLPLGNNLTVIATFNPRVEAPFFAFQRAGYIYTGFDRRLRLSAADLTGATALPVQSMATGDYTWFQAALPQPAVLNVAKPNQTWQVLAATPGSSAGGLANGLRLQIEPDYTLGARVLIPVQDAGQVLRVVDPVVGDDLLVVPMPIAGQAFVARQTFTEFQILPSLQGVVIKPLVDDLQVRNVPQGLEITTPNGLRLAASGKPQAAPATAAIDERALRTKKQYFDLGGWQRQAEGDFTSVRQFLQGRVATTEFAARDRARFDLARFYLAYGYGQETLGLLTVLASNNPDIIARPEFLAVRGAARILAGDFENGLADLAHPELKEYDDIALWRAVGAAEKRDFELAASGFADNYRLLENYEQHFLLRFGLLAAESFVATNNNTDAARLIDQMAARLGTEQVFGLPQVQYLRGAIQSRNGNLALAEKLWREAAASRDQLNRARAKFALIDLQLLNQKLSPAEAIKDLERLRFAWRGDGLELQVMEKLAQIHRQQGDVDAALNMLTRIQQLFPETAVAAQLNEQLNTYFKDLFLQENTQVSPLKAVALYEKYQAEVKLPPEDKAKIVDRLVEKMVAIDLLPQAAGLLAGQIEASPDAAGNAQQGARVAAIYLLDRQADAALAILTKTAAADLPPALQQERALLQARALSDQGKHAEAQKLLAGIDTPDAKKLGASVAWRARDWPAVISALNAVLPAPAANLSLAPEEAQLVLNQAIALSLQADQAALTKLNENYGAAMQGTGQANSFALLTRPQLAGTATLARIRDQVSSVDMFRSFLESYRSADRN